MMAVGGHISGMMKKPKIRPQVSWALVRRAAAYGRPYAGKIALMAGADPCHHAAEPSFRLCSRAT